MREHGAADRHGAAQGLTVFDPFNYQENLLSSVRALEQINNQVRQLQAQAQMIARMDQNLQRLGTSLAPDLQRTLGEIQSRLRDGNGLALRVQGTEDAYARLFPRELSATLSSDDVLRKPRRAGTRSTPACNAPRSLQGQIADADRRSIRACSMTHGPLAQRRRRAGSRAGRQRARPR